MYCSSGTADEGSGCCLEVAHDCKEQGAAHDHKVRNHWYKHPWPAASISSHSYQNTRTCRCTLIWCVLPVLGRASTVLLVPAAEALTSLKWVIASFGS